MISIFLFTRGSAKLWLNKPMRVIGTAGHVDHGKSTLIEALTGTHPDRLKEEQAREMTIELGFGWLTLPNGEEVGIVDVPGHRDFIENMLSGIGGIDAVLLVIAADEGIMPQTKEHLAILDLLQIPAGLIVLTKTDLASDTDWLDLIEADIRHAVSATVLKDSQILRVSAKTGKGIPEVTTALEKLLQEKPSRPDLNRPRLPIDRVFTISGFGTVVTGTTTVGTFAIGIYEVTKDPTSPGGGGIYRGSVLIGASGTWSIDLAAYNLQNRPVAFVAYLGAPSGFSLSSSPLSPVTQLGYELYLPAVTKN